jgi:hypothetical protein
MANDQSSIPSFFPRDPDNPKPTQNRHLTLIASDGKVLRSPEELTSHLLQPDRLSDSAFERLQDALSNEDHAEPIEEPSQPITQSRRPANKRPASCYYEPWKIGEFGDVVTCIGDIAVDPFGSTFEYMGPLAEEEFMRRIVACMNACHGVPTKDLEQCTGIVARIGRPL